MHFHSRPVRLLAALVCVFSLVACSRRPPVKAVHTNSDPLAPRERVPVASPGTFAENPIVYFVVTDRFHNGNPENDRSYGRVPDGAQEIGTFHGGDLAGLTRMLEDGYFRDLGINAIWITPPYEQIHGWVVGGDAEFRHYAYHGYWMLDYTVLDRNMGTEDELGAFIDTAHAQGIRVIFDVVMNHPGYADIKTLADLDIDVLWPGWEHATLRDYHSYIDYNDFDFRDWWGPDWVRSDLAGYEPGHPWDERLRQLAYLPDFRTESPKVVNIPMFFTRKPDTRVRPIEDATVRDYLVAWQTDWVRRFGVDGFRADTAKHVDLESWRALKRAGASALARWKADNPDKAIDDAPFWMTGEVFPHGVVRDEYFDHGFDNIINFDLQDAATAMVAGERIDLGALDALYTEYAGKLASDPGFNVLSYLSSHDTRLFRRDRLIDGGTILLLAPGGVQIFYGDESARPPGPSPAKDGYQATRSDMNWGSMDRDVLRHFQTLTRFRARHVALAKGRHQRLGTDPYTFARVHGADRVVVSVGATGRVSVPVARIFAEGTMVRDAYTGVEAVVSRGRVVLDAGPRGVILLEALE